MKNQDLLKSINKSNVVFFPAATDNKESFPRSVSVNIIPIKGAAEGRKNVYD